MAQKTTLRTATLNKRTLIVLVVSILAMLGVLSVVWKPVHTSPDVALSYPSSDLSYSDVSQRGNQGFQSHKNLEHFLNPPLQDWIRNQFEITLSDLNETYTSPSMWRSCNSYTYYFPNINTIFTGTPKTGCSNWKEALLLAEGVLKKQVDPTKVSQVHGKSSKYRMPNISKRYNETTLRQAFSFTAIRNPWTRMISGYRQKLSSEDTQGGSFKGIRIEILKQFRGVESKTVVSQNLYPTFREFVMWLIKYNGNVNVHFKPQYKVLCIPSVKYDFVVPVEYSGILSSEVLTKMDKNISLLGSYDKSSDPRVQSSAIYAKEWLPQLDTVIIEKLYTIFKADFLLLNYSNFTHPDFPLPLHD